MLKKLLASEAIKFVMGKVFEAASPEPTGLVVFDGQIDEFHLEMETLSDNKLCDARSQVTVYTKNGIVVGITTTYPGARSYCFIAAVL